MRLHDIVMLAQSDHILWIFFYQLLIAAWLSSQIIDWDHQSNGKFAVHMLSILTLSDICLCHCLFIWVLNHLGVKCVFNGARPLKYFYPYPPWWANQIAVLSKWIILCNFSDKFLDPVYIYYQFFDLRDCDVLVLDRTVWLSGRPT